MPLFCKNVTMDESLSWRARARRQLYQNPNIGNGLIAMSIAMGIVALSLSYRQRLHHTIGNLTLLVSSQSGGEGGLFLAGPLKGAQSQGRTCSLSQWRLCKSPDIRAGCDEIGRGAWRGRV